jgi:hypothetical protein
MAATKEVVDARSKEILTALQDEKGRAVPREKMKEIVFRDGIPIRTGDQLGSRRADKKRWADLGGGLDTRRSRCNRALLRRVLDYRGSVTLARSASRQPRSVSRSCLVSRG